MGKKKAKKQKKEPTYLLTRAQIRAIGDKAVQEATDRATLFMFAIPLMVIHDKYGQLMAREKDGMNREERFANLMLDQLDSVQRDYIELSELHDWLWEEAGIRIEFKEGKGKCVSRS